MLAQLQQSTSIARKRVGLRGLERVPVRDGTMLHDEQGQPVGTVASGLLSPSLDLPVAMAYVPPALATPGTRLQAVVRGKPVPMEVAPLPFVPARYYRG